MLAKGAGELDYENIVHELMHTVGRINRTCAKKDIKHMNIVLRGEMHIMMMLWESGSTLNPGDISRKLNVSTARTAAALKGLEKKGLVERRAEESDKRKSVVSLTEKGMKLISERSREVIDHNTRLLQYLGDEDSAELVRIVRRIAEFEEKSSAEKAKQETN